jgi:pimeloyl-ACP methyl ester carboxylesterase
MRRSVVAPIVARRTSKAIANRYVTTPDGLVRVRHAGHGPHTVVFVGGMGEGAQVWDDVLVGVADFVHGISYDRLGLGRSGPARGPRDAQQISAELHHLLNALKESRPVLLVSHSAGAFFARMFASTHAERVGGLVFVEPSHEEWLPRLKESDPAAWLRHMRWRNSARHPEGRRRELDAWGAIIEQMRALGTRLPEVPVTIVSATAGHAGATEVLFQLHREWAATLPSARHVVSERAGHFIEEDAPEVVVKAIEDTLREMP